jgi:hypothetical protein
VAAAVDDIERRHWQHKVSIASQVSEVLVQWHSLSQCNAEKKKKAHHKLAVRLQTYLQKQPRRALQDSYSYC